VNTKKRGRPATEPAEPTRRQTSRSVEQWRTQLDARAAITRR
jgi:hypothetical protein